MDNHNSQFGSDVEYRTLDRGTPAWGVKPGPDAIDPIPEGPPTVVVEENFDSDPLWSQVTFSGTSGDGTWALATDSFHSALRSFKSPALSSGQTATFTVFNDTFSPDLIFWARVDGGNLDGFIDGLVVKVDGVQQLVVSDFDTGWVKYTIALNFGFQVDFIYQQDFSAFTNRAWVDDIVFGIRGTPAVPGSPAHPLVYAPMHLTDDDKLIVTLEDASTTASTPVQVSQDTSADLIIVSNPARKGFSVQNTGTTVIKLALGTTNPTQTAYHIALAACSVADDGLGGYYSDDTFTGDVRAISSVGGGTFVYLEVS